MATPAVKKALIENGFSLSRRASHGELWEDGISRIMVSGHCDIGHPGFKKDLRNALKKRDDCTRKTSVATPTLTKEVPAPATAKEPVPMKPESISAQEPKPKGPRSLPLLVMTILTDPDLNNDQKVKMIMAYAELD